MLIRMTKPLGSWYAGQELDLNDEFAQRLLDEERAVRIENKAVKTLEQVLASGPKKGESPHGEPLPEPSVRRKVRGGK